MKILALQLRLQLIIKYYRLSHDVVRLKTLWTQLSKMALSVVYKISCECGKVYIGETSSETGRPMQDRIKEHDRDIQLAPTQTSAA